MGFLAKVGVEGSNPFARSSFPNRFVLMSCAGAVAAMLAQCHPAQGGTCTAGKKGRLVGRPLGYTRLGVLIINVAFEGFGQEQYARHQCQPGDHDRIP